MQRPVKWAARLALLVLVAGLVTDFFPADRTVTGADEPAAGGSVSGSYTPRAPAAATEAAAEPVPAELAPVDTDMGSDGDPAVEAAGDPVETPKPVLPVPERAATVDDPAGKMALNLNAVGIPTFRAAHGVSGAGVTIAVIDSGIDPGHPDLQTTPDGRRKVVDWKDFTAEGRVVTDQVVPWGPTFTARDGRTFILPEAQSAGGRARFGYWDESKVPGRINRDLDRNGFQTDRFGVLLLDPAVPGEYTQVYVDTDNDGDFRDEVAMTVFREGGAMARLGRFRSGAVAERQLAFVVADLDAAGGWVQFGFDSLGHGTQVAGVAAAYRPDGVVGAAPGAQLMALKVITSQDQGTWFAVKEAIEYAARHGAQVINVSLGGLAVSAVGDSQASEWLSRVAQTYGVLILLAADNAGPGLSSGTTIGRANELMTIGAYYSPGMWARDYGYQVTGETVWWRSGMGPRSDGAYIPSLVAPGGSPAPSPAWLHAEGYTTAVGTSVAVPHVAGAAALLLEAARRDGLPQDGLSLKRALESGAHSLPGLQSYEQGSGLLDVEAAYAALERLQPIPALTAQMAGGGEGLLARSYQPGSDAFLLTNPTDQVVQVEIASTDSWVTPRLRAAVIPPGQTRRVDLAIDPPMSPGVHSAYIVIKAPGQEIPSLRVPVTYVQPVVSAGDTSYMHSQRIAAARYHRYFIEVEPGTAELSVTARVATGPGGRPQGAVQMQVFRPDGHMVHRSEEIGYQGRGLTALFQTSDPLEGVWEVVVVALPREGMADEPAEYVLQVQSGPVVAPAPLAFALVPGDQAAVSVSLKNPGRAFTGRAVAYGLTEQDLSVPWKVVRQTGRIDEFTLPSNVARLRLEIANVMPAQGGEHLWLYRYERDRGWQPYWVAHSSGGGMVIELERVPAGYYRVFVQYDGSVPSDLRYQYRRLVAVEAYGIGAQDDGARRERGASWEVPLTFYTPVKAGRYYGCVILLDEETGASLAWLPVEVSVGESELSVTARASRLLVDRPGTVVLELKDAATGAPVDGVITVDGRRYRSRQGTVTVTVKPSSAVHALRVEADLPGYRPFSREIRLPVHQVWLGPPVVGGARAEEHAEWRSRAEWLLR